MSARKLFAVSFLLTAIASCSDQSLEAPEYARLEVEDAAILPVGNMSVQARLSNLSDEPFCLSNIPDELLSVEIVDMLTGYHLLPTLYEEFLDPEEYDRLPPREDATEFVVAPSESVALLATVAPLPDAYFADETNSAKPFRPIVQDRLRVQLSLLTFPCGAGKITDAILSSNYVKVESDLAEFHGDLDLFLTKSSEGR